MASKKNFLKESLCVPSSDIYFPPSKMKSRLASQWDGQMDKHYIEQCFSYGSKNNNGNMEFAEEIQTVPKEILRQKRCTEFLPKEMYNKSIHSQNKHICELHENLTNNLSPHIKNSPNHHSCIKEQMAAGNNYKMNTIVLLEWKTKIL